MTWFDRFRTRAESAGEPPESPPITVEEVHAEQNWPMLAALAVFALALAILIAVTARWAYHHWHKAPPTQVPQSAPAPPPTSLRPAGGTISLPGADN